MVLTLLTPVRGGLQLPTAARDLLRGLVLLLAACLALQGVVVSARRAMGPGHYHLSDAGPQGTMQEGLAPHHHDDTSLPFFGRLRSHALPLAHNEVEYHRHTAGTAGVVTLADGGAAPGFAALVAMLRSALDLPVLLLPRLRLSAPLARAPWPNPVAAAFDSRSTTPPLRPPRY